MHTTDNTPKVDSSEKLEYIYQHFQDCKKIHESDPDAVVQVPENTLYPQINNDIEYGIFEDIINSYYLDRQIKDNFACDKDCHVNTQQTQQVEQLTPCTHTYDHIT